MAGQVERDRPGDAAGVGVRSSTTGDTEAATPGRLARHGSASSGASMKPTGSRELRRVMLADNTPNPAVNGAERPSGSPPALPPYARVLRSRRRTLLLVFALRTGRHGQVPATFRLNSACCSIGQITRQSGPLPWRYIGMPHPIGRIPNGTDCLLASPAALIRTTPLFLR
jgi:hypothetical protein